MSLESELLTFLIQKIIDSEDTLKKLTEVVKIHEKDLKLITEKLEESLTEILKENRETNKILAQGNLDLKDRIELIEACVKDHTEL